jgi:hypothetical protein
VVADTLTYYYTNAFLVALDKLAAASSDPSVTDLAAMFPKKPALLSKSTLPSPIQCDADICDVDEPPGNAHFSLLCVAHSMHLQA